MTILSWPLNLHFPPGPECCAANQWRKWWQHPMTQGEAGHHNRHCVDYGQIPGRHHLVSREPLTLLRFCLNPHSLLRPPGKEVAPHHTNHAEPRIQPRDFAHLIIDQAEFEITLHRQLPSDYLLNHRRGEASTFPGAGSQTASIADRAALELVPIWCVKDRGAAPSGLRAPVGLSDASFVAAALDRDSTLQRAPGGSQRDRSCCLRVSCLGGAQAAVGAGASGEDRRSHEGAQHDGDPAATLRRSRSCCPPHRPRG